MRKKVYPLLINYKVLQILTRHVELESADGKAKFVRVLKVFFFLHSLFSRELLNKQEFVPEKKI